MRRRQWPWWTMALSPLGASGPVGPGQGQRPAGRTRPAVQGASVTLRTAGLRSQQLLVSPQPEVKVSLATRAPPLPGCGEVTEAGTGQEARLPALPSFSEMASFEKCLCRGRARRGRAGRLGDEGQCLRNQSPGAPLSDHFSKASHLRPLWGTESLSS